MTAITKKAGRDSNIELCRIICMLLIVTHHCIGHSLVMYNTSGLQRLLLLSFIPWGKTCFVAFVAMSTWYMTDKRFRAERFLKTWLQVFFYSVLIYLVSAFLTGSFSRKAFLSVLLPISGNSHGFAAAYLAYYLITPFLKMIADSLTRNQAKCLVILLIYFQSISRLLGTLFEYTQPLGSELLLFVTCFFISFYFKNYFSNFTQRLLPNLLTVVFCLVLYAAAWYYILFNPPTPTLYNLLLELTRDESSLLPLIGGYALFFVFRSIKVPQSNAINASAHLTFGILLIHDHNFFRGILWGKIANPNSWVSGPFFWGKLLASILAIFVVCAFVEYLRQTTVERWIFEMAPLKRLCAAFDIWLYKDTPQPADTHRTSLPAVPPNEKTVPLSMDVLKVLAVLSVFMLHTFLFSSSHGFWFTERTWFLKTPAWAAVWIFFFLSGVNIGAGFQAARRKDSRWLTTGSLLRFYFRRILKIAVPTWIFSILALAVFEPELLLTQPVILLRIFTFTYGNNPASTAIGATWYVSTLMWLYFIAPFLMAFIEYFATKFRKYGGVILWFVFLILGFALRWKLHKLGVDWSSRVYVPFYCNIDIYACGMLCSFLSPGKWYQSAWAKVWAAFAMVFTLILNAKIYFLADWNAFYLALYCFCMPSVYIVVTTLYVAAFHTGKRSVKITVRDVLQRPELVISLFAKISFEFYLVHSLVLSRIHPYLNASTPLRYHAKLLILGFVISALLAFLMHTVFQRFLYTPYSAPRANNSIKSKE